MHPSLTHTLFVCTVLAAVTIVLPASATLHGAHRLTKRELHAREQLLSTLPTSVREEIERGDASEYELDYNYLLERDVVGEDEHDELHLFEARDQPLGPGVRHCKAGPAMTYDDGPYTWTRELADTYADAGHQITYFINVNNFDCSYNAPHPEDLRHAMSRGHVVASHSGTHADFATLSHAQIDEQIQIVEEFAWKTLGVIPRYFRPPYGSTTKEINKYLRERWGLIVVMWSVDAGDAMGASAQQSINTIASCKNNDIVLNHETHESSVKQVAKDVVGKLNARGLKSRTVDQCTQRGSPYKAKRSGKRTRKPSWNCDKLPAPGKSNV